MPPLPSELLTTYETAVATARDVAEDAAQAVLTALAVADARVPRAMDESRRVLRRVLRARARQLRAATGRRSCGGWWEDRLRAVAPAALRPFLAKNTC